MSYVMGNANGWVLHTPSNGEFPLMGWYKDNPVILVDQRRVVIYDMLNGGILRYNLERWMELTK